MTVPTMKPRVCRQEDRSYLKGFLREFGLSVQMRLYTMHKREFVMVYVAFFAALGLSLFVGLAGPPITETTTQHAINLTPPLNKTQMATGPFLMKSPALSTYSQQLWVIAKFNIGGKEDESFQKEFHLGVTIKGITRGHTSATPLNNGQPHNRSRTLSCEHRICDPVTVMHLSYLEYTHFIITVNFYGLEDVQDWHTIKDIIFHYKTFNPAFTKLEIWFRFIFLVTTFTVTCWFAHTLRKYAIYDWSIEQKWMSILLPLLLLYNDPVFPLTFLVESWVPAFIDALFQASFLCSLLLFWLCIYHGLRQNERKFNSFYLPKFVIVGSMWLSAIFMATLQKYNEIKDPLYSAAIDTNHFHNFKIFFFIAGSMYVLYLIYLTITAYSELRSMPYFDVRLKFVTMLMLVVLSLSLVVTIMRFGVGVLEDNFVAELSTTYGSSAQFMSFYGLLNFYLYTMAYVYSPSERALMETQLLKDNPTLSMVNDSDEEVIYGSEDETRRPLNRSNDNDESD